jgi:hypothetical protein
VSHRIFIIEIFGRFFDYFIILAHFQRADNIRVDIKKSTYGIDAVSAEACASVCLNDSAIDVFGVKCMSFDFCQKENGNGYWCSMNNASVTTNPDFISENVPECVHYASVCLF